MSNLNPNVGFRGRGRPFISQDIPIRRPNAYEPTSNYPSELAPFAEFFDGTQADALKVLSTFEDYFLRGPRSQHDITKLMEYLSRKVLDSSMNVANICKYLYVFSKHPDFGDSLRTTFFIALEAEFKNRQQIKQNEGPTRYRNFIQWIMAAAHHFRNLSYAPFDELMVGLLELAQEISNFNDPGDIQLYSTIILRFYYYTSLPSADRPTLSQNTGNRFHPSINKSRLHARRMLSQGGLSVVQIGWLTLLLEVTWSSPTIEKSIADYYNNLLPGFSSVLPDYLKVKIPEGSNLLQYLGDISHFVVH